MKIKMLLSALLLSIVPHAFAVTGKVVYTCSNGEETEVVLREISEGVFEADVTVQSVGDSYPTFHFRNVKRLAGLEDPAQGSPVTFQSRAFEMTIRTFAPGRPATVTVQSIGLDKEELSCK